MTRPGRQADPLSADHFYIDDSCIGCTLCVILAPSHFYEDFSIASTADGACIHHQPATEEEKRLCREVMALL